jgi:hypothetical protein
MISRPLLFVGEGFFPYVGSFAGAPLAKGPVVPPLFGVSIHRTPSPTRASQSPRKSRYYSPAQPSSSPSRGSPGGTGYPPCGHRPPPPPGEAVEVAVPGAL